MKKGVHKTPKKKTSPETKALHIQEEERDEKCLRVKSLLGEKVIK